MPDTSDHPTDIALLGSLFLDAQATFTNHHRSTSCKGRSKQSKNEPDDSCSSSDNPAWTNHSKVDPQQLTPMLRHYVELKTARPEWVIVKEIDDGPLFLHQLVKGGASSSYGITTVRSAGVLETIFCKDQHILDNIPKNEIELLINSQINNLKHYTHHHEATNLPHRNPQNSINFVSTDLQQSSTRAQR